MIGIAFIGGVGGIEGIGGILGIFGMGGIKNIFFIIYFLLLISVTSPQNCPVEPHTNLPSTQPRYSPSLENSDPLFMNPK